MKQRRVAPFFGLALILCSVPVASTTTRAPEDAGYRQHGIVTGEDGRGVGGARISVGDKRVSTGADGRFELVLAAGTHVLRVDHPDYLPERVEVDVAGDGDAIEVRLSAAAVVSDSITVDAIRAAEAVPVTKRTLDEEEIEQRSHGQDVPALLEHTPSITWYSDSGSGSNYSYFSLRGINQTRINITLDGAPLNDPAEHALYFNNFKGIADAVDSIQVQRGVGTSTVGSPSYGGSVNFASAHLTQDRQTTVKLGYGTHATRQASLLHQTGRLGNGLALSAHVFYAASDNYRERSGTEHATVFVNGAWQGRRSQLKLVAFSGREESQLAFYAVDPQTLAGNPRFNPLAEEERDRFGQQFAQLQYVRSLAGSSALVASLYYNGADGWFRLWDDPVERGDLLEFGIDQHFIGSMVSLTRSGRRSSSALGVHLNDFRGDHTLDVGSGRAYLNTGFKTQANGFAKVGLDLGSWHLFGDLQVRWAEFDYRGDVDVGSVDWTFVDPKVGLRYAISSRTSLYASIGKAEREPSRLDLLAGEDNATVVHDLEAVRPEKVVDLEVGIEHRGPRLALQAAVYDMRFDDEIAATGELSEIGLPLRTNVDHSYRRGLEVDLRWRIADHWQLTSSASFSRNRIREWTQFYDVFDSAGDWVGSEPRIHRDVEPLLTPELIVNQGLEWNREGASVGLEARWVAASFLDNTADDRFRTPAFATVDLRAALRPSRWSGGGPGSAGVQGRGWRRASWSLHVENLIDERDHYPGGYSYLFINRDPVGADATAGIPYFYPQAGRTAYLSVELPL